MYNIFMEPNQVNLETPPQLPVAHKRDILPVFLSLFMLPIGFVLGYTFSNSSSKSLPIPQIEITETTLTPTSTQIQPTSMVVQPTVLANVSKSKIKVGQNSLNIEYPNTWFVSQGILSSYDTNNPKNNQATVDVSKETKCDLVDPITDTSEYLVENETILSSTVSRFYAKYTTPGPGEGALYYKIILENKHLLSIVCHIYNQASLSVLDTIALSITK